MSRREERNDAQAFDDAWSGRAPRDAEIAALVRATEKFLQAAAAEPATAFRQGLRDTLMVEAETALVTATKPAPTVVSVRPKPATSSPLRRRIAGLTAAVVASMGAVVAVTSSASAIPGDALYPVKRGVENVALAFHRGDASEGTFQLARASERLAEARALTDDGESADLINETLRDFTDQAEQGADALLTDYTKTGSMQSIDKVNDFAAASSTTLAALSSRLPSGVSQNFDKALNAVTDAISEASSLCTSCSPGQVQSLVDAVSKLAAGTPTAPAVATTSSATPDPVGAPTAPAPKPVVQLPAPNPTPTSLGDVTDPLLGVLLGDDDQQGLVPSLLGGLLGGGQR